MNLDRSLADRELMQAARRGDFWTLDRLSRALGGGPAGSRSFVRISTDTREIQPGDVFVALRGESYDAHNFLEDAVAKGAGAVVISNATRGAGLGVPVYVVADTLVALGALAAFRRRAWASGRIVVGITGSNGKTSTKDLTNAALSSRLEVFATRGNLNNRVGLPLSILSLPDFADAAVLELGTSLPGEIATLRDIAGPQIALITSVSAAHLEGLGSVSGVLLEKASICDGVPLGIVPASMPDVVGEARKRAGMVVTAGLGEGDFAAERWGLTDDGTGWLVMDGVRVSVPLRGEHNLRNAMLALAVARTCGVSLDDAARGIAGMSGAAMRLEMENIGDALLINDAYNANPGSTLAAIELLAGLPGLRADGVTGRQRVLILGTMRELGAQSVALHAEVAAAALQKGFDIVAGVGEFASALQRAAGGSPSVVVAESVEEIWELLQPMLDKHAMILLKASRGVQLERIVPFLRAWASGSN